MSDKGVSQKINKIIITFIFVDLRLAYVRSTYFNGVVKKLQFVGVASTDWSLLVTIYIFLYLAEDGGVLLTLLFCFLCSTANIVCTRFLFPLSSLELACLYVPNLSKSGQTLQINSIQNGQRIYCTGIFQHKSYRLSLDDMQSRG